MTDTMEMEALVAPAVDGLGLNRNLRCDNCNAQAFISASKEDMLLLFCMHHGRKHEPALAGQGWTLEDESAKINSKPTEPTKENYEHGL